MVYNYLLQLYKTLAKRENSLTLEMSDPDISEESKRYAKGRIDTLRDFSDYLHTHYDEKLPRRLQTKKKDR